MVRALSLYLPSWPIERLRRRAELRDRAGCIRGCILLVNTVASRQIIVHMCSRAEQAGVTAGMTLAHARALLPPSPHKPWVQEHDPQRDAYALLNLAHWAVRFVPICSPDPPDGVLMNAVGCSRLYGDESTLLTQLCEAVTRLGFTCSVAIAPTYGAAWAMARFGGQSGLIVEHIGQLSDVLASLPVQALRLDDDTLKALDELGVRRVDHLLDLPRSQMPSRFSEDLVLRIDQVLGQAIETINPVRATEPSRVIQEFAGPVKDIEMILLSARQLLDQLMTKLLLQESGVLCLQLRLERYEAQNVSTIIRLSRPTRDAAHLWRLLHPKLEGIHLGHGVEAVEIEARESARVQHRQQWHAGLTDTAGDQDAGDEERGRLLDTLVHRLGHDNVSYVQCAESHLPERVARHHPIGRMMSNQHARTTDHDRPTVLFECPDPIDVQALTPDGPVLQIKWRGSLLRVNHCTGPERISPEWWRKSGGNREYFKVQCEAGPVLWVFRDGACREWFVHGRWA